MRKASLLILAILIGALGACGPDVEVPGPQNCIPQCSEAQSRCVGDIWADGCNGTCQGQKKCICTPDCSCAFETCVGETCANGCLGQCQGLKTDGQCACAPNCACAANTCIGLSCSDGCGGFCSGTKQCQCVPDCSCAANTCVGQTCSDGCGGTCQGTKTGQGCGSCPPTPVEFAGMKACKTSGIQKQILSDCQETGANSIEYNVAIGQSVACLINMTGGQGAQTLIKNIYIDGVKVSGPLTEEYDIGCKAGQSWYFRSSENDGIADAQSRMLEMQSSGKTGSCTFIVE